MKRMKIEELLDKLELLETTEAEIIGMTGDECIRRYYCCKPDALRVVQTRIAQTKRDIIDEL